MTLKDAISKIHAPKGVTSVVAGILSDDFSVLSNPDGSDSSLTEVQAEVSKHESRLRACQSDFAYWSILGEVEYWRSVRDLIKAAEISGSDNLPDVDFDDSGVVVMDVIGKVRDFGKTVLSQAQSDHE